MTLVTTGGPSEPGLPGAFRIGPSGATPIGAPTFQQCLDEVIYAINLMTCLPLAIGDILNYMMQHWPDKYAQAIDGFSQRYSTPTLYNYMSVARRVPQDIRRPELSWNYHEAVAGLSGKPDEQRRLLDEAAAKGWNYEEMRQAARIAKGHTPIRRFQFRARKISTAFRAGGIKDILCEDVVTLTESGEIPTGEADVEITEALDF